MGVMPIMRVPKRNLFCVFFLVDVMSYVGVILDSLKDGPSSR